jgi:hypothetical protein
MSLVRALAQRWGATVEYRGLRGVLDGAPFRATVTEGALVHVTLDAPDVAGFTMTIEPRRDPDEALEWASLTELVRYGADDLREAFLRRFAVTASDRGLVRIWLDDPARDALLVAPERYTLAGGALTVAPFAAIGLDGFERTLRAAVLLVTRPHRLAQAWRDALPPHAIVPAAWSTDDGFEIRVDGLAIDTPWRPDAPDGDRLRTRISGERRGAREPFALWRPNLVEADRPDPGPLAALPAMLADRYVASGAAHRLAAGPPPGAPRPRRGA